ncbi:MAG: 23S rRNA (adenine(2503)-C(2))-methyltransferase RlmN [Nitrospirae bacterium CG22_combo_CG10-13_8_21_14_all_44_11]|nr:23S rRNA (adenine(2503)-C(2))-methyltransferase RlmN [Nitrospirota bacterium]PIP69989.1 MAG: 23S rRNA (adenine(2503)-C(2))-methyltransferase RlmN [Nitrospirae bacterium CG22_combo_CG10-13_8_21_14_all_44_11]PIV42183.1 MAG: 23S rRNA (adenine(2503)-C(2))-methyltransferase RlmN [Nitrospirae bacterium CG02_land_8_20_14_3_00_44_33]PIV67115.1 MAG: 23S rRNA (adenine(2503)-C(2))-methyltransferase RlmN [Nitrospirae bacterium CG01_land_8_20_14_3_00_44_22]PIW89624.1 MAG: 23S rRNA (adenine(2503)-C(2))-me
MSKINLKALSKAAMEEFVKEQGLPAYRAKQILHWIYEKKAESIENITEFSRELRKRLSDIAYISNLELLKRQASEDGAEKFLFGLEDGESIESVLIPDADRHTLCISSQVGCAMSCGFCLTGGIGFKRNLKAHEIVDQLTAVMKVKSENLEVESSESKIPSHPPLLKGGTGGITNIVFMGMGEPLLNLDEVVEALLRITGFMGFSKRRITLSTCGIAPAISELYRKAPHVNLAVSLNAASDEVRNRLMTVNKKYPIRVLLDACRKIPLSPRDRITFEYVMIDGMNDSLSDAKRLVTLLRGISSKVNLIPFNLFAGSRFKRPSDERVLAFQEILVRGKIYTFIRKSKGQDILAACGQLKAGYK